jgi:hypothetical protein
MGLFICSSAASFFIFFVFLKISKRLRNMAGMIQNKFFQQAENRYN